MSRLKVLCGGELFETEQLDDEQRARLQSAEFGISIPHSLLNFVVFFVHIDEHIRALEF